MTTIQRGWGTLSSRCSRDTRNSLISGVGLRALCGECVGVLCGECEGCVCGGVLLCVVSVKGVCVGVVCVRMGGKF